ncbi:hypothetical protein ACEPAH_1289 [Sanghuangporus vaninii]
MPLSENETAFESSAKISFSIQALLNESLGAMFIGLILSAILFGITNAQAFTYFHNSKRDHAYLRVMIAFLWSLDVVQLALLASYMYYIMVTHFSDLLIIGKITGSLCAYLVISGTSDFIIRLFYSRRIWFVSDENMILTAITMSLSATTFAFGLGFSAKLFSLKSILEVSKISWLRYAAFGSDVITDFTCAISLLHFIRRGKTGMQTTEAVVNKLTLYIISTGLLTSFVATASFATYVSMPNKAIFAAIFPCLSKLYFSALLATLNARKQLREDLEVERSEMGHSTYRTTCYVHMESLCSSEHPRSLESSVAKAEEN